ncbi:hypothetical protein K438DRAFT_1825228 [Mycena galopus ATCC 62051]|nr:hypothetical protein K438DRAFT_1825228 [Mycena galopus ATCC 62051]
MVGPLYFALTALSIFAGAALNSPVTSLTRTLSSTAPSAGRQTMRRFQPGKMHMVFLQWFRRRRPVLLIRYVFHLFKTQVHFHAQIAGFLEKGKSLGITNYCGQHSV